MKQLYKIILPGLLLMWFSNAVARQVTANQNGPWKQSATWVSGFIPTNGDTITIPASIKVVVSTQEDYSGSSVTMKIRVYGELNFQSGKKLTLPAGSTIEIYSGGSVSPGTGGGNSNYIEVGTQVVWNAATGTVFGYMFWPTVPLPVELLYFHASNQAGKNVRLEWATGTEVNNDFFFVERSDDGSTFKSIAIIDGNGTTSTGKKYEYTDTPPFTHLYYYRLRQRDYDGKTCYSEIIKLKVIDKSEKNITLYPNPSRGPLYMSLENFNNNSSYSVQLYDTRGNKLMEKELDSAPGTRSVMLHENAGELTPGIYNVRVVIADEVINRQVVVW